MITMKNNEDITMIGKSVNEKLLKYEKWLLPLFVVLTALKLAFNSQIGILTAIVALVLGAMYFLSAFAFINDPEISGFDKFIIKIIHWASSVCCVSILFKLFKYPGRDLFMQVGLYTIALSMLIILFQKMRGKESKVLSRPLIIRVITLIAVIAVINFIKFNNAG